MTSRLFGRIGKNCDFALQIMKSQVKCFNKERFDDMAQKSKNDPVIACEIAENELKDAMNSQSDQLSKTFELVVALHSGQFRKANDIKLPYAFHPMQVMSLLYDAGLNEREHLPILQAALAHDVLEDTTIDKQSLSAAIGEFPTSIVEELTFKSEKSVFTSGKEYQDEKTQHLYDFKSKSLEALVIKVADRICNILDFLKSDKNYAKIYCGKAVGLWEAFDSRFHDVENRFGENFAKALNTKAAVVRSLL